MLWRYCLGGAIVEPLFPGALASSEPQCRLPMGRLSPRAQAGAESILLGSHASVWWLWLANPASPGPVLFAGRGLTRRVDAVGGKRILSRAAS